MALPLIMGLIGGAASAYGSYKNQKDQNKILRGASEQYQPRNLLPWMQAMNPELYNAYFGYGTGGQSGGLYDVLQNPGYIDPRLQNAPIQQSMNRGNMDFIAAQGRLGKSGMRGGMGDAYALANSAANTQRISQIQQQYALWRENQRRQDLQFAKQSYGNLLNQGLSAASGTANMLGQQQAPINTYQIGGNALLSGLSMYSPQGMQKQQQQQPTPQNNMMGMQNIGNNTWAA